MSFPSIVDGKPLISHRDEKLDTPTGVDEPTPAVLP
jgi:hypothetical protein